MPRCIPNKALQPVLFETVILASGRAMKFKLFSELLRTDYGAGLAGYVLHMSLWKDSGDFGDFGEAEDGRQCAAGIIARCPNIMKLQTRISVLRLLPYPERGFEEVFVRLEQLFIPAGNFAHTSRLHIADMQQSLSKRQRIPGAFSALYAGAIQPCLSLLTADILPRLECFSSTWVAYQMEDDDHASVLELMSAVLALPSLTRIVFRLDGVAEDLPALMTTKDPRVRVVSLNERDASTSDNLTLWAHDAMGQHSMWSGRPVFPQQGKLIAHNPASREL